jgi:hypothetical protein
MEFLIARGTDTIESGGSRGLRRFALGRLGEVVLLIACIIPGLILSRTSLQEPWTEFPIARAAISMQHQHLPSFATESIGFRGEHGGLVLVLGALAELSAWPLQSLALLPLGSLILAIAYYAIARKCTQSTWTAAALTLFFGWYYPRLVSRYATNNFAWTNCLFFCFLVVFWYWLRHRTRLLSLLILTIFIVLFLQYHTTPVWVIAAVAVAAAFIWLEGRADRERKLSAPWALPVFCIVAYLGFDTVLYGDVLARVKLGVISEGWVSGFITTIAAPLLGRTPDALGPFQIGQVNPRLATWTTLAILLMLMSVVGGWCSFRVYRMLRDRSLRMLAPGIDDVFCWAVVAAAVAHTTIYVLYGTFSDRVVPLAFPLIVPLIIQKFPRSKAIESIWAWTLAGLAVVGFVSYLPSLQPDILTSETGQASRLFGPQDRLLAGSNTYGSILLSTALRGESVGFVWPTPEDYAAVTGQQAINPDSFDYFVFDSSNKPVMSLSWVFLEPWAKYYREIAGNPGFNKVYEGEKVTIFRPVNKGLPRLAAGTQSIQTANDAGHSPFRLLVSVVVLLFVPGAVLLFILHDTQQFRVEPVATRYGLVVGFSIMCVTFIGYLANLTPLGLESYVPLCVGIPWLALAIYWLARQPHVHLQSQWIVRGLVLLGALSIWALLSTATANSRSEDHRLLTEFFVTQVDPQSSSFAITAVNGSEQARNFTFLLESGGLGPQVIGQQNVAAGASWTETWHIPPNLEQKRLSILLDEGGVVESNLHFRVQ